MRIAAKATAAISSTLSPESNVQVLSVRRCRPARGRSPASSNAGKIRTSEDEPNVAKPDQPERGADQRAGGRDGVAQQVRIATRRRRAGRVRAASQATTAVGTTTSATSCQSAVDRETAAATSFQRSIADGLALYFGAPRYPMEVLNVHTFALRFVRSCDCRSVAFLSDRSAGAAQQSTAEAVEGRRDHKARQARPISARRLRRQLPATPPTAIAAPARSARSWRRAARQFILSNTHVFAGDWVEWRQRQGRERRATISTSRV